MEKTRVVFRTWKRGEATVVALFPDTLNGDDILVYEHEGQHSTTSKESVIKTTRPATVDEFEDLFHELKRFHYKNEILAIRKKCVKIERHGK